MVRSLFLSSHYTTLWLALSAVLQGIAAIIAFSALRYSMTVYKRTLSISNYTELDRMYFDLLRTAVDKPHLLDPGPEESAERQKEYDSYAFMVWNFLETIYDRCHGDRKLSETWYPVIDAENGRHRKWFDDPQNRPKFKQAFCDFIDTRHPYACRE